MSERQGFAFSSHGFLIRLSNALFLERGGVDFDLPFPVSRSRFQDLGQPPGSRESLFGRRRKFAFLQFAKFFEICFPGSLADRLKDLVLFNPPKVVFAGRRPPEEERDYQEALRIKEAEENKSAELDLSGLST